MSPAPDSKKGKKTADGDKKKDAKAAKVLVSVSLFNLTTSYIISISNSVTKYIQASKKRKSVSIKHFIQ